MPLSADDDADVVVIDSPPSAAFAAVVVRGAEDSQTVVPAPLPSSPRPPPSSPAAADRRKRRRGGVSPVRACAVIDLTEDDPDDAASEKGAGDAGVAPAAAATGDTTAARQPAAKSRRLMNPLQLLMDGTLRRELAAATSKYVPGLYQFENFLTEQEAARTVACLDEWRQPWPEGRTVGPFRLMQWGVRYDRELGRYRQQRAGEASTPDFLQFLIERMCEPGRAWSAITANWRPNEGNANSYVRERGDHLRQHFDDRAFSGRIIASVTLLGNSVLSLKEYPRSTLGPDIDAGRVVQASPTRRVPLPSLCLQLLTGDARYNYTHECGVDDLLDPRRVSVVFRQAKM